MPEQILQDDSQVVQLPVFLSENYPSGQLSVHVPVGTNRFCKALEHYVQKFADPLHYRHS